MALSDILSATSVILVFVILAFDKLTTVVGIVLKAKPPDKIKKIEFENYCKEINRTFIKALIVFLILLLFCYLFIPTTLKIFATSNLDLWNFDLLQTLFVIIEFCIISMSIYIGFLTCKLFQKKKSCR